MFFSKRIFSSRSRTPGGRSTATPLLGLLATAIFVLATLSLWQRSKVDEAQSSQVALDQISVLTRKLNNLKLRALQEQDLTEATSKERGATRRALHETALAVHLRHYHTPAIEEVWPAFDNYARSADIQWTLVQVGNFEEAKQAEFQSVGPQFDLMQHQIQLVVEAEEQWAQGAALRSTYELLAAAILAATAVLILFLRLQQQEHFTQLQETERNALRESEERFRALTEQSTDIILISDPSGRIKYASPSVDAILDLQGDVLLGTNISDLVHPDDIAKTSSSVNGPGSRQNSVVEVRLRHANGDWIHFECVVRNLIHNKNIGGIVYNARDITDRKNAQEKLLFNASHDVLTGLPNRVMFIGRLQSVVDQIKRHPQQSAAVLFIDIDDFKIVNDCYGHAIGDALIKEVSSRLLACIRGDGTVARIGGDEFTILVEDISDPSDAIRVAERIQSSLKQPFLLEGVEILKAHPSVSR